MRVRLELRLEESLNAAEEEHDRSKVGGQTSVGDCFVKSCGAEHVRRCSMLVGPAHQSYWCCMAMGQIQDVK